MVILLFLIGLAAIAFVHLIIPFCFSRSGKTYPNKTLWLIAGAGGLLGFAFNMLMDVGFMLITALLISGIFTLVGYTILKKKCSIKQQETAEETTEENKG